MSELADLRSDLATYINPEKASSLPRFFKTQKGQYGEGDVFLGVIVPHCRKVATSHSNMSLSGIERLLASKFHEERLVALLILVQQYSKGTEQARTAIYDFYLSHTDRINNWDLVDLTSRDIIGRHIYDHSELLPTLGRLASSQLLWDRRITIIATFYFLQKNDPAPTLHIAEKLLPDRHDLIHKATGWMLRETGKRIGEAVLINFLKTHYATIPRTTLRYAIERFPVQRRQRMLNGDFS